MSAATGIILLEWIGTFFLAIEAIKLHNLSIIREKLRTAGGRLHPVTNLVNDSDDEETARFRFGTLANVWLISGVLFIMWLLAIFHTDLDGLLSRWQALMPEFWGRNIVAGITLMVGVTIGGMILGYVLFRLALLFLAGIVTGLGALERNTANGVAGIFGFFLFSTACILKLSGFH